MLTLLLVNLTIRVKSPVQLRPVVTNEPRFVHIERTREVIQLLWTRAAPASGVQSVHYRLDRRRSLGNSKCTMTGTFNDCLAVEMI